MLNWMARGNIIGGIYSRPVAVGNLIHFAIAALAMVKLLVHHPDRGPLWAITLVYAALALGFGAVVCPVPGPAYLNSLCHARWISSGRPRPTLPAMCTWYYRSVP